MYRTMGSKPWPGPQLVEFVVGAGKYRVVGIAKPMELRSIRWSSLR
jgi:hypothetical protein